MLPNGMPANDLSIVRSLAQDEDKCEFFQPVLDELRWRGMDTEDLRDIICLELGEIHCYKVEKTRKYYPETFSDYYSIFIMECSEAMFLKLLVIFNDLGNADRLVITSFKKDNRHDA